MVGIKCEKGFSDFIERAFAMVIIVKMLLRGKKVNFEALTNYLKISKFSFNPSAIFDQFSKTFFIPASNSISLHFLLISHAWVFPQIE